MMGREAPGQRGVNSGSQVKFINSADTIDLFINYQF